MATIEVNKIVGGASAYGDLSGVPITSFPVTTADCENTTNPTTVLSFTIPANTLEDNERIEFDFLATISNNTGGTVSWTPALSIDGEVNTLISSTLPIVAAPILCYGRIIIFRYGTECYIIDEYNTNNRTSTPVNFKSFRDQIVAGSILSNGAIRAYNYTDSSYNFDYTKDLIIGFQMTFGTADASVYWRMENGGAYKKSFMQG